MLLFLFIYNFFKFFFIPIYLVFVAPNQSQSKVTVSLSWCKLLLLVGLFHLLLVFDPPVKLGSLSVSAGVSCCYLLVFVLLLIYCWLS